MVAAGAPLREEQYRAKYGRYTPAYEARLKETPAASIIPDCCRSLQARHEKANGGSNAILAEERSRVK